MTILTVFAEWATMQSYRSFQGVLCLTGSDVNECQHKKKKKKKKKYLKLYFGATKMTVCVNKVYVCLFVTK